MSNIDRHLDDLKKFKPRKERRVNKIYFLEVNEKPNMVKVGDTLRSVDTRNRETMTNSSLHRKAGTKPTYVIAKKYNGKTFRDKEFHKFLRNKGYKFEFNDQGNYSEWVMYTTIDQLMSELKEFTKKPVHTAVTLRKAQQYVLQQLAQSIEDDYTFVNFGGCVRIGKTIISLEHSAKYDSFPVYISKNLTSQASAEADNGEFGIVPKILTQSLHGIDELDSKGVSKRARAIINKIKRVNKDNKKIMFWIDEVDDSSHTRKSRDILRPIIKHFEKKGLLQQVITMSGTRIHRGEKVLRSLTDGDIKEISVEYYEMQILQPETTVKRNYRHVSFYSDSDDGLANISDSMKNKDEGHESIGTVIKTLLGKNKFDIVTNDKFPHWFMKFATVGKTNCNALVRYLNSDESIINTKKFLFKTINGDVTTSKESEKYCKNIIKSNPEKTCVFVSQGMATTSFSVKSIGNSVVFTDNEITSDDIQALHRSATWDDGKDDCNMTVITTNESCDHSFDDIFEEETKLARDRDSKKTIYRELLDNNSMMHFTTNGKSVRPVNVTLDNVSKVLDKKAVAMTKLSSFVMAVNDLDEEVLDEILSIFDPMKSTSTKSVSTKGDTFDPFEEEVSTKKQNIKKMSKKKREMILREFSFAFQSVPAVARMTGTTIDTFVEWDSVKISKSFFDKIYNMSLPLKDRVDTAFDLCEDDNILVTLFINKMGY